MKIRKTIMLVGMSAAMMGTAAAGEIVLQSVNVGQAGTVTYSRPAEGTTKTVALYPAETTDASAERRAGSAFTLKQFSAGNAGYVSVYSPR